ncbi:hypothetical protein B0H17DRAFT_1228496 [Mycena rosella]|uniref:Uncharacterized protein n=1 Tax=Mycena rosella TaxID=1033263 RepID=A0AAD7GEB5_MYCRO|nr:hypothetical protein B0H17DRAFT_1228496 [Mycena rosella]
MYPPFLISRKASTSDERATRIATEHRVRKASRPQRTEWSINSPCMSSDTAHVLTPTRYKPQVEISQHWNPWKTTECHSRPSRTTDKDDSLLTQGGGEGQSKFKPRSGCRMRFLFRLHCIPARNLGKVSKRDRRASSTASFKLSREVRVGCGRPEAACLSKRTTTRVGDFFAEVLVVGLACHATSGMGWGRDRREDPDRDLKQVWSEVLSVLVVLSRIRDHDTVHEQNQRRILPPHRLRPALLSPNPGHRHPYEDMFWFKQPLCLIRRLAESSGSRFPKSVVTYEVAINAWTTGAAAKAAAYLSSESRAAPAATL